VKKFLLLPAVTTFATLLLVAHHEQSYAKTTNVHGYTKKDGTTVAPHHWMGANRSGYRK